MFMHFQLYFNRQTILFDVYIEHRQKQTICLTRSYEVTKMLYQIWKLLQTYESRAEFSPLLINFLQEITLKDTYPQMHTSIRYDKATRKVSLILLEFVLTLFEAHQPSQNQNAKVKQLVFCFSSSRSRL